MKLYCLAVLYKASDNKVQQLKSSYDLQQFGYFQRNSVKEFMDWSSKVIVERTPIVSRSSTQEKEYVCHVYVRSDHLAAVVISDQEYPKRVAHTILTKLLEDFAEKIPASVWSQGGSGDASAQLANFKLIDEYLVKYQNPKEADAMTKLQADLDETKIILHNTIEAVLQRGEKIDDLVEKSESLSATSKAFYTTAKKTNRCCVIL